MNETQRATALRLADELERGYDARTMKAMSHAAALLRELAAKPVQEPIAWGVFVDDELFKPFNCKDEAVDWFQAQYNHGSRYDFLVLPLYAAPQQRKPLTDEQIKKCADEAHGRGLNVVDQVSDFAVKFTRAIEHAHGIIGEPT